MGTLFATPPPTPWLREGRSREGEVGPGKGQGDGWEGYANQTSPVPTDRTCTITIDLCTLMDERIARWAGGPPGGAKEWGAPTPVYRPPAC